MRRNPRTGFDRLLAALCLPLLTGLAAASAAPAPAMASAADANFHVHLAWQIALDRAGFSPGVIDGRPGRKAILATREFQKTIPLDGNGMLDQPTAAALGVDPQHCLTTYTLTQDDPNQVGPAPKGWVEKSKLDRLAYESLEAELGERFHCAKALLEELNPGKNLNRLKPGDAIQVPAIAAAPPAAQGSRIDINLAEKVVRIFDKSDKLVGLFHCSIAADKENLPSGSATVAVIANNPTYIFDPEMWEDTTIDHKLTIPPGPRNPVGLCWVGLSLPGYGIHGTPAPEMIGRTGSHGCFRLANWDAVRLGKMVRVGAPVSFTAVATLPSDKLAAPAKPAAKTPAPPAKKPESTDFD